MKAYSFTYFLIFFVSLILSQIPVDLGQNQTYTHTFLADSSSEYLMDITLSSDTSWEDQDNESAILSVFINDIYNQDIVIYNGQINHSYQQAIGYLESGEYQIDFYFDYTKSSIGASNIHIETINFTNTLLLDTDTDVFKYSPILYGRNIFAWNESNYTDIPLLLYHDIAYENGIKIITYGIIFSNEDSRVGIGLSDMMLSWGRTTDIEWIYQVSLNQEGEIVNEIFQGASHITTPFNGEKLGTHPYLINATANCNFSDTGTSDYIFFLSAHHTLTSGHTREYLMDQNPWSYKIMGQELINENKYENEQDPTHWEMSDVRNYLYMEYEGYQSEANILTKISTNLYNDCYQYSNNHNNTEIIFNYGNGINRTAIELPENFSPSDLQYLTLTTNGDNDYNITLNQIINLFYLSNDYDIMHLDIQNINEPIILDNSNPTISLLINEETLIYDCNGDLYGTAICDECSICYGGNTGLGPNQDMDDCGVCFGNNSDIDCAGECFGNAYIDDCYVCDDNPDNDNQTCDAGCLDINAENYDANATIDNGSCIYSDRIFNVPEEYEKIGQAILFASNGDTVLVEPGTYYEEIDFMSKSIFLLSTDGPSVTSIIANSEDGYIEEQNSVITIRDANQSFAYLDGFTLQGGYGKGVDFEYFISVASDPEMFNDMMYNYISSGGVSIINSSVTLSNLIIKNNSARNFGAGIGIVDSYTELNNIILEENNIPDTDALGGSGIAINGGATSINNCTIRDNSVGLNAYQLNGGGGILCGFNFAGNPLELIITNSQIYNNSANIGAGIGALSGNIQLNHVLMYANHGDYGSAISLGEPLGLVVDNINMSIINSTITDNQGVISFGLIDNSNVIIANSILWNEQSEYEFSPLPNNSIINVESYYSDIRILNDFESTSSISLDPLFIDINNYNFNLTETSPCIDSGIDFLTINNNTLIDIDLSEYSGIMPDMGYFEYSQILYGDVNQNLLIDIVDLILMINIILNQNTSNTYSFEAADTNQDDVIDIIDVVSVINIILDN
tara:strand:+ start:13587 stop:16652 length:3066 start_codon:yes stop_codon:yes gene_type:complete